LIDQANMNGFAALRGRKRAGNAAWDAVTAPVGAEDCVVDWSDLNPDPCAKLDSLMLMTTNQAEAESEFLHLRNLVAGVVPDWKEAWPAQPAKNTSRLFFDPGPERTANRRAVEMRYNQLKSGAYAVHMTIESAMTPAQSQAAADKAGRDMAGYVAGDVQEFLSAAAQGFEAYKDGAPATRADGVRWWKSSRQPFLALDCEIRVRGTTKSYF
jgi:hypothetical protein